MKVSDTNVLLWCSFGGIVGGLIGFGSQGTIQGSCLGAGIGMIVPVALILLIVIGGEL